MKRGVIAFLLMCSMLGGIETAHAAETDIISSGHRYRLVASDCTWNQAFQAAKEAGGRLACFETQDEYNQVLTQIANSEMTGLLFRIGGRRDASSREYHWVDGENQLSGGVLNDPSSWTYPMWMSQEPSFLDGDIVESYMDLYFYDKESRWVLNDVPDDIIAIAPGLTGRLGYIIEFEETDAAQPQSQSRFGTWQETYREFVLKEQYLSDDRTRFGDENTGDDSSVSYALHDMNQDGTPELIIYNGDWVYAGSMDYLYTFSDGSVQYVDTMASSCYERYVCVDGLPGIFSSGAHTGGYWTTYYSFDGSSVYCEEVWSGTDDGNYDPVTGEAVIKEVSHTEDGALYNAYLEIENGGGRQVPFVTMAELSQKGWDGWLEECGYATASPLPATADSGDSVLSRALGGGSKEFYFSSGAGAWGTSLTLNADGTFTGSFHDSNMGADNETYPGGERLVSDFSGSFTDIGKMDEYTYSMRLASVAYEQEPGTDWTDGTIHYIAHEAYGISGGEVFYLYLPGHPIDTLPDSYMSWAQMYLYGYENSQTLPFYGLYNVKEELGWGS